MLTSDWPWQHFSFVTAESRLITSELIILTVSVHFHPQRPRAQLGGLHEMSLLRLVCTRQLLTHTVFTVEVRQYCTSTWAQTRCTNHKNNVSSSDFHRLCMYELGARRLCWQGAELFITKASVHSTIRYTSVWSLSVAKVLSTVWSRMNVQEV